MRAATHWDRFEHTDGIKVDLIYGNEVAGPGNLRIVSVLFPSSSTPAHRIDSETGEIIEPQVDDAPNGLVLFGGNKWSRAHYSVAARLVPEAAEAIIRTAFCFLLDEYGSITDLARESGLSYRAITYKRDGERPVRMWDVWAIERALQLERD